MFKIRFVCAGQWGLALNDAESCIQLRPTWPRGHACRGAAFEGMDKLTEALESFKTAQKLSPSNPELVRLEYLACLVKPQELIS